jgi:hypothetical protein
LPSAIKKSASVVDEAPVAAEAAAVVTVAAPVAEDAPVVAATVAPTDIHADLADVIAQLKQMAEDASKIAGVLVHQERERGRVNHGAFDGGGYAGARTTADDPGLLSRLRTLSTACTEFANQVRRT